MRILLTGIYGFIGSNLAMKFKFEGHEVIGIDAMTTSYDHQVHTARRDLIRSLGFQVSELDLSEFSGESIVNQLNDLTSDLNFDAIVHLAAWPGVLKSELFPDKYFKNNVVAFVNVLSLIELLRPSKFLYASSSSVYGDMGSLSVCEEDFPLPEALNFYAKTKQVDEQLASIYPNPYGTEICGLRFFTVIGPWGRPDMSYWNFTEKVLSNEEVSLRGETGGFRDFTDIDDLTGIISKVLRSEKPLPKILNISNTEPKSARDIVDMVGAELHILPRVKIVNRSGSEADTTVGSKAILMGIIDDWEWIPISTTIKNFIEWYRKTY